MVPVPAKQCFRFSLRTIFVVITLCAIWIGWQASIVRERKNLRAALISAAGSEYNAFNRAWNDNIVSSGIPNYKLSWFRIFLGDTTTRMICLPPTITPEQVAEYKRHFPEAFISISPKN
jgi:hypothetical protein